MKRKNLIIHFYKKKGKEPNSPCEGHVWLMLPLDLLNFVLKISDLPFTTNYMVIIKSRHEHKIHNSKFELNSNRTIRSIYNPKCKKYLSGSYRILENIFEPEMLLTKPEQMTWKPQNFEKREIIFEETDFNVQISMLTCISYSEFHIYFDIISKISI